MYRYYRRKVGPKVDVTPVIVTLLTAITVFQVAPPVAAALVLSPGDGGWKINKKIGHEQGRALCCQHKPTLQYLSLPRSTLTTSATTTAR